MEILNSRFKDMGEFMNTKPICLFMIFVFVFLLLACKPSTDQSNRSTPSDDSADSGDSPPEGGLVEDCGVTVDIYVWLDENANGVVDSGEKPVPNVVVGLDGASQQTDKYGKATAGTFTTCCTGDCWIGHSALVEIPNGYNPTTPTEVPLTEKGYAEFGLTIDPSIPLDFINTHGVPMRLIPEGVFTMGSNNGNADERPIHKVYLDAFYIDKYEVTNTLYKACVDVGVCKSPKDESSDKHPDYYNNAQYANYPVINIDWDMAMAYCEWRGEQLPTEAQWEKAARGTDARTYPWGEEIDIYHANYRFPYGATKSVGSYENGRSPYGTYDMAGNVWEWVNDWYDGTYYSTLKDGIENPIGPDTGKTHVLRGGSWADEGSNLRTAFRYGLNPSLLNGDIGFRCVGDASP